MIPNLLNKDKSKKENVEEVEATQRALIVEQQVERTRRLKGIAEELSGRNNKNDEGQVSNLIETTRKQLGDLSLTSEEIGDGCTIEPYTPFRREDQTRKEKETETETREVGDTGAAKGVETTQGHDSRSNLFGSGSAIPGSQGSLVGLSGLVSVVPGGCLPHTG